MKVSVAKTVPGNTTLNQGITAALAAFLEAIVCFVDNNENFNRTLITIDARWV